MEPAPPRYPHLFSPLSIDGVTLRNRVGISAHFAGWWVEEGLPNDAFAAYIEERSRGGIGLFVVGATAVRFDGGPTWMQNLDDRIIPQYRLLVDAAHRHGAMLFAQLIHMGDRPLPSGGVIAPAPRAELLPPDRTMPLPPVRTREDLHDLVRCFGAAAGRAREGGADGVEVHSHESFLHAQLLNPVWNRRTDEYGGSLENRMRFLVETLQAIRKTVGSDYPVGVRLKADDMQAGAMGAAEYREVVRRLEELGLVSYVSVTGGDGAMHHGPFPRPDGEWLPLVGDLRGGMKLPLMHAGRITMPEMAEQAVAGGKVDVVLMTKAHIADPHFTRKAQEGRESEIRYCTRCLQSCVGKMEHMTCIYNPVTSRERGWARLEPAARRKRVVVVGAGPAGMEAALTAALRGHEVIVVEKGTEIGGQVRYACRSPLRAQFGRIVEFYERQAQRGLFEVRLGIRATHETVLGLEPDAVVLATGSTPLPARVILGGRSRATWDAMRAGTSIDGPEAEYKHPSLDVWQALDGKAAGARSAVIIDREGFTRPLVVADHLSSQGTRVELVTSLEMVSPLVNGMSREELLGRLGDRGVRFSAGEQLASWDGESVRVRSNITSQERAIPGVDCLVIANGSVAFNPLEGRLVGEVPELHVIGDANHPATVEDATRQGGWVGRQL